jgi:hypothetical protein
MLSLAVRGAIVTDGIAYRIKSPYFNAFHDFWQGGYIQSRPVLLTIVFTLDQKEQLTSD